jgi:hypothetical protein
MGSAKKKRSHAPTVRDKNILNLYNKLHEIVSLLAELLHIQLMTDTTVLHLSTLGKLLIKASRDCVPAGGPASHSAHDRHHRPTTLHTR